MNQNYDGVIKRWVILTQEILGAKDINTTDKIVLAYITSFEQYYSSNESAAKFLGLTERTIQLSKQKLVRLGYITVLKNTGRGKIYTFNVNRLSKYCQSDCQNSDNQTVKKLTTYNKDKEKKKDNNAEKNSAPVEKSKNEYGRADINELEDLWLAETGINIRSQMNQRRQLSNLVKKYGYEPTKTLVRRVGVAIHSRDRFAPQIATPSELTGKFSKLPRLELWENRNKAARPFGNHLERSIPDYNGAWDEKSDEERAEVSAMMREFRQKLGANSNRRTL